MAEAMRHGFCRPPTTGGPGRRRWRCSRPRLRPRSVSSSAGAGTTTTAGGVMLCVGVDFGTSNSSAAVYDGSTIHLLPLDHAAVDPRVMRSLVYIERSGDVWCGQTALSRYLEQSTGRAVHYEMQRAGEVT